MFRRREARTRLFLGLLIFRMKLDRDFYLGENTVEVARDLLGKLLVVPDENGERISGMIEQARRQED